MIVAQKQSNEVLQFGKYVGRTFSWVAEWDRGYIRWCGRQESSDGQVFRLVQYAKSQQQSLAQLLWDDATENWKTWFADYLVPRIAVLATRGVGNFKLEELQAYGHNTPRRTWTKLAKSLTSGTPRVPEDLIDRQARWRDSLRRAQAVGKKMRDHYDDPAVTDLLLATWWL